MIVMKVSKNVTWGIHSDIAKKVRLNAEEVLFPKGIPTFRFRQFFGTTLGGRAPKIDPAESLWNGRLDLQEFGRSWLNFADFPS